MYLSGEINFMSCFRVKNNFLHFSKSVQIIFIFTFKQSKSVQKL